MAKRTRVAIGVLVVMMASLASMTHGQWSRAVVTWDPERYPPNRGDWSDPTATWALRRLADVADCRIPRWDPRDRRPQVETSVVRGALARVGQTDLAVLCVHADQTSATSSSGRAIPRAARCCRTAATPSAS